MVLPSTSKRFIKNCIWLPKYLWQYFTPSTLEMGKIIITFDVETANDFVHWRSYEEALKFGKISREVILKIIKLSEDFNIPITWFATGNALLKEYNKEKVGIFSWVKSSKSLNKFWLNHDWFHYDPLSDYKKEPLWYFGDLVEKILNSKAKHEIGSHTFSHIRCDLASQEEFTQDINRLIEVVDEMGVKITSHAFPWNKPGYLNLLSNFGIKTTRLKQGKFPSKIERPIKNGVTKVLQSLEGAPLNPGIIKMGINIAMKKGLVFCWLLHPEDIAGEKEWTIFKELVSFINHCREKKKLMVTTMNQL